VAVAAVLTTAVPASAQQGAAPANPAPANPAPASPAPASPAATAPKAAAPKAAAPSAASSKGAESYSLGVMWGTQLHDAGITSADLVNERFQAGLNAALSGKASMTPADQQNLQSLLHRSHDRAVEANHNAAAAFLAANAKKTGVITTASGLQYKVLQEGSGASPKATDTVSVNYRGTTLDGREFDSSYKTGKPVNFPVGRVIPGWTEGLQLMKPGGKYQLFIPPQLAYDAQSPPGSGIPPGSMLVFDVDLLSVQPPAAAGSAAAPGPAPPKK
jgi:FKBP-type peptidyl-prolyl cis-trans isomerase FklB